MALTSHLWVDPLEDRSFCPGGKWKRLRNDPADEKPGIGPQRSASKSLASANSIKLPGKKSITSSSVTGQQGVSP